MQYAETEKTIPEIADELGVRGVVASSLTRHGDTVRIHVQLIEAEPQEDLVWSSSYDQVISSLYTMYGEGGSVSGVPRARNQQDSPSVLLDDTKVPSGLPVSPSMVLV